MVRFNAKNFLTQKSKSCQQARTKGKEQIQRVITISGQVLIVGILVGFYVHTHLQIEMDNEKPE